MLDRSEHCKKKRFGTFENFVTKISIFFENLEWKFFEKFLVVTEKILNPTQNREKSVKIKFKIFAF